MQDKDVETEERREIAESELSNFLNQGSEIINNWGGGGGAGKRWNILKGIQILRKGAIEEEDCSSPRARFSLLQ